MDLVLSLSIKFFFVDSLPCLIRSFSINEQINKKTITESINALTLIAQFDFLMKAN